MTNNISCEEKKEKARERAKEWYWKNHDRARANNIAWIAANKEHRKVYRNERKDKASEVNATLYISDKDRIKARNAAWNKAHPDTAKTATNKWREKNPEKIKATYVAWKKANAKKVKDAKSAWDKKNPQAHRRYCHNRRALVIGNGGKLSPGLETKLLAFQKNRCAICRKSLKKIGHHLDHIVPLARGGKNTDGNMQVTCPTCNLNKHSKDPIQFMREKGFLL